MKRLILKSKHFPVEIHVVGLDAIELFKENTQTAKISFENPNEWYSFNVESHIQDHKYVGGGEINIGDHVEIEIAKGVLKRGEIVFSQQAYCFKTFESHMTRVTPICCFAPEVKFHKIK